MNTIPIKTMIKERLTQWKYLMLFALCQVVTVGDAAGEMLTRIAVLENGIERHEISAEIAITPEQKTRGLSNRETLDKNAGMLFLFDPPQVATMWMADTFISLDMLFINVDGEITSIATHTKPESHRIISSVIPVRWVLEIPAGRAATLGVQAGDRLCLPNCAGCLRINPCEVP